MKGNLLVILICVFVLLLITGVYFVYQSFSNEGNIEKENSSEVTEIENNPKENTARSTPYSDSVAHSSENPIAKKTSPSGNINSKEIINGSGPKHSMEPVVDQTAHSVASKNIEPELTKNVVGSEKEKIEVEITLYDGQENKLLSDFFVAIKYEDKSNNGKFERYRTDKNGKFAFMVTQTGFLRLQLLTKEYSSHSKTLNVLNGKNVYMAKLFKGGFLEIRATNAEGKAVPGLIANLGGGFKSASLKESLTLEYDASKGTYLLSNVPVGPQDISFKAAGYQSTDVFKVKIEPSNTALFEVRMNVARMLFFELDIKSKPDLIFVTHVKTAAVKTMNQPVSGRLPNRGTNAPVKTPGGKNAPEEEKTEVFKNQNGLFEYELLIKNATAITLEVEGYVAKDVAITPDRDTYKVTLIDGFSGKLQINNEKGLPVANAVVNYTSSSLNQSVLSDDKGVAILSGMTAHMPLRLNVTHNSYATLNDRWEFDANEQNTKAVVLKEGKGISGKIKFESKFVANAKVFLYQSGKPMVVATTDSASDGSYSFNKLDGNSDTGYMVSAFHHEYGVANSGEIKIEDKNPTIDLTLVKEKSLTVKLVNHKGEVMPNKNITVINNFDSAYSFSVMTDEKGEYEFFNLIHGLYSINLVDSKFKCKEVKATIPAGVITLTAKSKELRKVNIKVEGGKPFTGDLRVTLERNDWPIVVVVDEDGYFVEFQEGEPVVFVRVVFHSQGYGDVRMGPYERKEDLPNEFNVEFRVGENFKVKVVDDMNNSPIPFVTVDVFSGNSKVESLPTNDVGEISFSYLSGKFVINVKEDGYAVYSNEFDGGQNKELVVRLIKNGGIKGHLTLSKEVSKAFVILQPGDLMQQFDSAGNFENLNITPGEYTISVSRTFKDNKTQLEKIPASIIIEREKTLEINLDDYVKNQTTLEVLVFNDGRPSTERGILNITDRRGQSVVSATVDNGKYNVERILPGEYLLRYTHQGRVLQRSLAVLPNQANTVEIYVPGSSLTFSVKNTEGVPISKVMVTLYSGEKYRQEDTYLGNQMITDPRGQGTFFLMPKTPYYFIVEEDFRYNYQINMIGPIILEAGQEQRIDYILPYARKLPKLQVTDMAGKALADVGFLFNDENGNFFQRTLLKEWDFFPYSNAEGFLPENSWPKEHFTLVVGKEGYEYKEIQIPSDFDATQLTQIKLNKASTVICSFPQSLPYPISVGILNKDGVLLQKPIPYPSRKRNELTVYYENISSGSVKFNDLAAGDYFIGYYWNGSNRLISKQGPIKVEPGKAHAITSTLQIAPE